MRYKRKIVLAPSAYNHKAMDDVASFIPLYKDTFDLYVVTDEQREEKHVLIDGVHYVRARTSFADYLLFTADYIIDAGGVLGSSRYSASQTRVSVWHGTPYKRMFVDLGREHIITALDYCANVDLMVSPSPWYTERFLRQSMLYRGKVLESAIAKTDGLFIDDGRKSELREILGIPPGKRVMLYAPTFRTRGEMRLPFDVQKVATALGDDWVIVTKLHYLNTLIGAADVVDATATSSVDELLSIADLLVTDYSSLMFDYSVLGKPCLFFQYDRTEYERDRAFMFDLADYVEAADICLTQDELLARLENVQAIGANLERLRQCFYPHQKPHAARELARKLDLDATPRDIPEVIFLVNELNQIGGVHTFAANLAREFKRRYNAKVMIVGKREFDYSKNGAYFFDPEGIFDIKLSAENDLPRVKAILRNTDGYVISCQYGVHRSLQRYLKGRKSVLMFHGDAKDMIDRTLYSVHLDGYNQQKVKNYRRLAVLTKGNAEMLKPHLAPEVAAKLTYIENGMDFSDARNLYAENGQFAFIARLDPDKNPLELIDIFGDERLDPRYHLHIYGDGSLAGMMRDIIRERGLSGRITMHGYTSDKEEAYRGKQGIISTGLTEGLPYTILESVKYGIPVYAYDSFTAAQDIIGAGIGVRVETGNREAFVEALNHPFDMSRYDNSSAIERFSNDTVATKWKQLFDELDQEVEAEKPQIKPDANRANALRPAKKKKAPEPLSSRVKAQLRKTEFLLEDMRYERLAARWHSIKARPSGGKQPLVSIIMPYYNNFATVAAAVQSVNRSSYKNYEVILVNDGSNDDPRPLISQYKKVRYFYKENGGLSDARNFGLKHAIGKYVLYLDSDDLLYPDALAGLVRYAERHELPMVCGTTVRRYVEQDKEEIWCGSIYKNAKPHINNLAMRHQIIDDTISTGKLYLRSALEGTNVTFKRGLYEDILYTGELYAKLDRIGVVPTKVQAWMVYGIDTSITRRMPLSSVKARLENADAVFNLHNDTTKVYLTRQYIRQHAVVSLNDYQSYSDAEMRDLFDMLRASMELRRDYVLDRLIPQPSKKLLYRALLGNDYDTFALLAAGFSEKYLAFYRNDDKR